MKQTDLLVYKAVKQPKNYVKYRIVSPTKPLSHLEMDIKFMWVEEYRTHAFILTILDIFTRRVLAWHLGMSITQHTVKEVFSHVIIDHLQPADMLSQGIHIEIRNDNDKRFSAHMVQEFFKENFLNQVFTHPYTPEENGHIESFHSILSEKLKNQHFETLEQLEQRLISFYNNYNNHRLHGSICGLHPQLFTQEWHKGNIKRIELDNRKVKFKLLIPKYQISDNENPEGASCYENEPLDGASFQKRKVDGATTHQPSAQRSPSVASC